jgi:hypothetical protein
MRDVVRIQVNISAIIFAGSPAPRFTVQPLREDGHSHDAHLGYSDLLRRSFLR